MKLNKISSIIQAAGISDQARFAPDKKCLLYVENYRLNNGTYTFEAYSSTCGSATNIATIGIFLMAGLTAVHYYFFKKEISPNKNVLMGFFGISMVWTLVTLVIASMVTAGLNQTCLEFTRSERSCGAVFAAGFFEGDVNNPGPGKNFSTVSAAAGAGWMVFLCWLALSMYEYYVYRSSTIQWWSSK